MSATLFPEEIRILANIPEGDLIDLAAELDVAVPEQIDRVALTVTILERLAALGKQEGLPLSDYDRDDLEALPEEHRRALATLLGVPADVSGMLKAGKKVYRVYRKTRPRSPVALLLPMLLGPLARFAAEEV